MIEFFKVKNHDPEEIEIFITLFPFSWIDSESLPKRALLTIVGSNGKCKRIFMINDVKSFI